MGVDVRAIPEVDISSFASQSFNRRKFIHGAALTGATAISIPGLSAQENAQGTNAVTSLIRPAASENASLPPLAPSDRQPPALQIPKPEKKLGWAVVGLGELTLEEILPAFGATKRSKLTALVSGHPEKARQLAEVYNVPSKAIYNYENFDSLRDNPDVDVIYIVLPNSMHAEFTIRGLQAGKHVLCEKPMAVTTAECEQMIAAAEKADRKLGVAYRLHYEPTNLAVMKMCKDKKFGAIKTFTASNCQYVKAPNIRLSGPLGGGPIGDVGVYCINAARYTIGEEPLEVSAFAVQPKSDPRFREVPESVSWVMRYPSGIVAECECSFGTGRSSSYQVLCETGSIKMNPAYTYEGLKLWTESTDEGVPVRTEWNITPVDQFASEMDGFSTAILGDKPVKTPGEMGLSDIRIVLAVMESARLSGQPVKV